MSTAAPKPHSSAIVEPAAGKLETGHRNERPRCEREEG